MTQAKPKFSTFEDYLSFSNQAAIEGYYELIDGELVQLPPESGLNDWIALNLRDELIRVVRRQLVRIHTCEIQVPVLQPDDAANRYPDLVILRPEHLQLTAQRLTITLDMSPPLFIAEVVSPGKTNRDRDYINKRAQYAAIGVEEYWIIAPESETIVVFKLEGHDLQEMGQFQADRAIESPLFKTLALTAEQVFHPED